MLYKTLLNEIKKFTMTERISLRTFCKLARISRSSLYYLSKGDTKKPQNSTLLKIFQVLSHGDERSYNKYIKTYLADQSSVKYLKFSNRSDNVVIDLSTLACLCSEAELSEIETDLYRVSIKIKEALTAAQAQKHVI